MGYFTEKFAERGLLEAKKTSQGSSSFPDFWDWCLKHDISEDEAYAALETAYNDDTKIVNLANDVKSALGKKTIGTRSVAMKTIKHAAEFAINSEGPAAKKIRALVPKYAEEAYEYLSKHWDSLVEGLTEDAKSEAAMKSVVLHKGNAIGMVWKKEGGWSWKHTSTGNTGDGMGSKEAAMNKVRNNHGLPPVTAAPPSRTGAMEALELDEGLDKAWKKVGEEDGVKHYKHKMLGHEIKIGKTYQAYAQSHGPAIKTNYQDLHYKKEGQDKWTTWGEVKNGVSDSTVRRALDLKEDVELAKKLVRGEQGAKGILNKLDHWLMKAMFTKDKNRFMPAEIALKALRSYGFSEDQVTMIREAAMEAAQTAIKTMETKHGESVPKKYQGALASSFNVFDLYLNVGEAIHEEFAALMRKLFDAKLEKIKEKLVIVKEDAGYFSKKFAEGELFEATVSTKVSAARSLGVKHAAKGLPESDADCCPFPKGTAEYRAYWDGVKEHARANPKKLKEAHENWFEQGKKVKLRPEYADGDPNEVFTLQHSGRGNQRWIGDEDGRGWYVHKSQVYPAKMKSVPDEEDAIYESKELQSLGRSLVNRSTASPSTPPADQDGGAKDAPAPGDDQVPGEDAAPAKPKVTAKDANLPDAEEDTSKPEFKVGDVVKPLIGPHKGQEHSVTKVYPDGQMDIVPKGIEGNAVKYPKGGAKAKPDQVVLAESIIKRAKAAPLAEGPILKQITIDIKKV